MANIHRAASSGNLNRVRMFLNSGTNVNARNNSGQTALHWAAMMERLAVVRELLDRGANVNARNNNGQTALHLAAYYGHLAVVRELLDRGANVNARGSGQTALHWAASFGHLPVVRLLLDRGANTNRVLNRRNIRANIRNAIIKHKAGLTIAKYYKAATLRRRAATVKALGKSLPPNITRTILSLMSPTSKRGA